MRLTSVRENSGTSRCLSTDPSLSETVAVGAGGGPSETGSIASATSSLILPVADGSDSSVPLSCVSHLLEAVPAAGQHASAPESADVVGANAAHERGDVTTTSRNQHFGETEAQ